MTRFENFMEAIDAMENSLLFGEVKLVIDDVLLKYVPVLPIKTDSGCVIGYIVPSLAGHGIRIIDDYSAISSHKEEGRLLGTSGRNGLRSTVRCILNAPDMEDAIGDNQSVAMHVVFNDVLLALQDFGKTVYLDGYIPPCITPSNPSSENIGLVNEFCERVVRMYEA